MTPITDNMIIERKEPEMSYKCPYGCTFECQNKEFLKDHIILKHLTPQIVREFAEYLIRNEKQHHIKYKIEAEIQ